MSKIIYNDRAYGEIIDGATDTFIGTNGTNPGTSGLVPAPSTTDRNKYLKSDGTWAIPAGGGTGGTSNYEELTNLPSINNQILLGNVELNELGLGNFITTFVLDLFYPVGSYYETQDATFDPNTAWGGTWELEEEGLVHIGAGSTYNLGDSGGEVTHTLNQNEIPNYNIGFHPVAPAYHTQYNNGGFVGTSIAKDSHTAVTNPSSTSGDVQYGYNVYTNGGDQAHNNMQPYKVVNRWLRTA